jgi:hypothetical protein
LRTYLRQSFRVAAALATLALAAVTFSPPCFAQAWSIIPPTQTVPPHPEDPSAPWAEIYDFRVFPDRLGLDSFGLARHGLFLEVSFRAHNMNGKSGRVDLFFRPQGGDFIPEATGFYASIEGLVSVRRPFNTLTENDRFDKVGLFMPREELRLKDGSYTLETVVLIRSADRLLGRAVFSFPYNHRTKKDTGPSE